jgi:hypothetical protein
MNVRVTVVICALVTGAVAVWLMDRDQPVRPLRGEQSNPQRQTPPAQDSRAAASVAAARTDAVSEPTEIRDWTRSFNESADDFLLAQQLVEAALAGDARADYILSEVLLRCEVYRRTLMAYTEGTVQARVEFHLANGNLPDFARNKFRREALRCERLFVENPFEAHDLPDESRDFRYWAKRALEGGDPVAVMNRVFRTALDRRPTGNAEQDRLNQEAVMSDIRRVISSGDVAALFTVGGMFSNPSVTDDLDDGYAWIVAACELGYDCSTSNPALGSGCVDLGTCVQGTTLLDSMQRDFTPAKYAAIYANAQDIQYKIRTNDWDGLQQYLQLKD